MAQRTYYKDGGEMVADESLDYFLTSRGWNAEQVETPAPEPRKRAAKKTAAPKQSAPAADPNRQTPTAANRQEN